MKPIIDKYLPLDSNSSGSSKLFAQRQKDHYSHFILRLAFSSTEDLRRRFNRVETMLFRIRYGNDDLSDRAAFVTSLNLDWCEPVSDAEKNELASELAAMMPLKKTSQDTDSWVKVDWDLVPDLIETRRAFVRRGKAYVPAREQASMIVAQFSSRLEKQLDVRDNSPPFSIHRAN
jgi:DNA primase large subunit